MSLPISRAHLSIILAATLPVAACFDPTQVDDTDGEASTAGDTATTNGDTTPATGDTTSGTTNVATSSTGPGPDPTTDSGATSDTTGGVVDSSSGTTTGGDDMGTSSSTGSDEESTTGPVVPAGMCNELLNVPCGVDQWCDYPDDLCGAGEHGTCLAQPQICNLIFAPHCGCDGATHSNQCVANGNGTDIDHPGEC